MLRTEVKKLQHALERRRIAPTKAQARLDRITQLQCGRLAEGSRGDAVKNVQAHLKAAAR